MTSPLDMVAGQAGASAQSSRDLQNQLGHVGNLRGKNISPEAHAKKLREACEGFESIFIQKMWQEMRNAVPKGGLLQGREEKFWQDMYDQELSKSMTKAGGIGLADMMYAQLSRNLGAASKSSAGAYAAPAFTPAAASVLPQDLGESPLGPQETLTAQAVQPAAPPAAKAAQPKSMPSIYDGEAPQSAEAPENSGQNNAGQNEAAGAAKNALARNAPAANPAVPGAVAQNAAAQKAAPLHAAAHEPVSLQEAVEKTPAVQRIEKKRAARKASSRSKGESAIDLAQIARREAGDKLGSRAIRPPLHPQKSKKQEAAAAPQPAPVDSRPGTADDLQRAMQAAMGGAAQGQAQSGTPLADMVARVKAARQNAQAAQPVQTAQAAQPVQTEQKAAANPANPAASAQAEEPAVRKVTYSTNIPKNSRAKKGNAIRMLNVENTGPNSRAGKGLAAYHAQQAEAAQLAQPAAAPARPEPLTVQNAAAEAPAGFTIPPLTTGDLKS